MKNKKESNHLLLGFSILGSLAIVAGTTAGITASIFKNKEKNNTPEESEATNKEIANALSAYIDNPIQIISSTITSNDALLATNQDLIKTLILNKIKQELLNKQISINNKIYTEQELISNINIQLPANVSYINYSKRLWDKYYFHFTTKETKAQ